jgi:hypothetical protein
LRTIPINAALAAAIMAGCNQMEVHVQAPRNFGDDVAFLKQHTDAFVLSGPGEDAQLVVVPAYQGRVMTSTAGGPGGFSYGWINYDLIASGKVQPHINAYGGEDRFWMGPEGGQYSIFFSPGDGFTLANWQTPAAIDTEPFELLSRTETSAALEKRTTLRNRLGTPFDVLIKRRIELLGREQAARALATDVPPLVEMVAYQTANSITNAGTRPWTRDTGLLSIWILGMFKPSPQTTVVIPFRPGPEADLGPQVNDAYFGKVSAERLVVGNDVLFFSGDGRCRSKIGLSPQRARPVFGSYDGVNGVLTIVQYDKPEGVTDYVNSMWELQAKPFAGDTVNAYNDGPPEPGTPPLGPFYELETSSPASALEPGETTAHRHCTFHLHGLEAELDRVARAVLGVRLAEIASALAK